MHELTRRAFIGTLPALAVAWPELHARGFAAVDTGRLTIAPATEPGQRLLVTGTIVGTDGKAPLANMRLSVYHTDNDGYYSRPVDNSRNARLRGSLVTDASGRYEIRTIWPGHYPGGGNPRHIHVHLAGPDTPEHWIDSFLFEGDRVPAVRRRRAQRRGGQAVRVRDVYDARRGRTHSLHARHPSRPRGCGTQPARERLVQKRGRALTMWTAEC